MKQQWPGKEKKEKKPAVGRNLERTQTEVGCLLEQDRVENKSEKNEMYKHQRPQLKCFFQVKSLSWCFNS